MILTTSQKWLRTLAWLRREFPASPRVTVRSVRLKGLQGDTTEYTNHQFAIRINSEKPLSARLDTIIHEWAHVLTWFGASRDEDHSDEWGLAYAKIYRAHNEWNYGRKGSMDD